MWQDPVGDEAAHGVADQPFLVVEQGVDVEEVARAKPGAVPRRLAMPVLASGCPRVNRIVSKIVHAVLEELVVLDFSRILAGPLATMLLGDYGATVIKIERPGSGDDTRSWTLRAMRTEPRPTSCRSTATSGVSPSTSPIPTS